MEYIQTTSAEAEQMLQAVGVPSLDALFKAIPAGVRLKNKLKIPAGLTEPEVVALLSALAKENVPASDLACFLGAGKYNGYIPAVVDDLAGQSEFYTAYTPYQAEASQGNLQLTFEYQTMISELTGLEVSNASHYDAGTALAESLGMAIDHTGRRKVVVSGGIHPSALQVVRTFFGLRDFRIVQIPLEHGTTPTAGLAQAVDGETAGVVLQHPNFLGHLEPMPEAAEVARKAGAIAIASVEPVSLGVLQPPGRMGFQIAVGDGQTLGNDLFYGGPTFGFVAATKELIRRMPGRIVGQTTDQEGRRGFVLTLQAREQHIRREKATSNICTNQALMAHRSAIFMAAVGKEGFRRISQACLQNAHYLADRLREAGAPPAFDAPFYREFAVRLPRPASEAVSALLPRGILAGADLGKFDPEWKNLLLVSTTELSRKEQMDRFARELKGWIG